MSKWGGVLYYYMHLFFVRLNRSGKTSAPSFVKDTVNKNDISCLKVFNGFTEWLFGQSDYSEKSELPFLTNYTLNHCFVMVNVKVLSANEGCLICDSGKTGFLQGFIIRVRKDVTGYVKFNVKKYKVS